MFSNFCGGWRGIPGLSPPPPPPYEALTGELAHKDSHFQLFGTLDFSEANGGLLFPPEDLFPKDSSHTAIHQYSTLISAYHDVVPLDLSLLI